MPCIRPGIFLHLTVRSQGTTGVWAISLAVTLHGFSGPAAALVEEQAGSGMDYFEITAFGMVCLKTGKPVCQFPESFFPG